MRRFLTAALLAAIAGVASACSGPAGTTPSGTASPRTSAAAASQSAATGNTAEICAAANTLVNSNDLAALGRQFTTLATAGQLNNAETAAAARTAIRTQAGTWAQQLGELQQRATDPALAKSLGTLATSLTTLGTEEYLSGVKTVEDAGTAILTLGTGLDTLTKSCA